MVIYYYGKKNKQDKTEAKTKAESESDCKYNPTKKGL